METAETLPEANCYTHQQKNEELEVDFIRLGKTNKISETDRNIIYLHIC